MLSLNLFLTNVLILYPLKTQGFPVFSGSIQWQQWPEMAKREIIWILSINIAILVGDEIILKETCLIFFLRMEHQAFQCFSILVNLKEFQPSVLFHIETSHLFCTANQMTDFYTKCNTGPKWVKNVPSASKKTSLFGLI